MPIRENKNANLTTLNDSGTYVFTTMVYVNLLHLACAAAGSFLKQYGEGHPPHLKNSKIENAKRVLQLLRSSLQQRHKNLHGYFVLFCSWEFSPVVDSKAAGKCDICERCLANQTTRPPSLFLFNIDYNVYTII